MFRIAKSIRLYFTYNRFMLSIEEFWFSNSFEIKKKKSFLANDEQSANRMYRFNNDEIKACWLILTSENARLQTITKRI